MLQTREWRAVAIPSKVNALLQVAAARTRLVGIRFFRASCLATGIAISVPTRAQAHIVGIAEQVLQPVTSAPALLPLIGTAILLRQSPGFSLTRRLALALALGLVVGLIPRLMLPAATANELLALVLGVVIGAIAATGGRTPELIRLGAVGTLGVALGANLLSETKETLDLVTSLCSAFAGTLIALEIAATLPGPHPRAWQTIGERIAAAWTVAIATMLVALAIRRLM